MQQPDQSLPKQTAQWKDLKAAYRLLSSPHVDPHAIQHPHRQATLQTCDEHPVVLCVQDTTELDFTPHHKVSGLGRIGNGAGRGLVQHTSLAVAPMVSGDDPDQIDARLLGILDQRWYTRVECPKNETRRQRQARWTEPDVWADAAASVDDLGTTTSRLIHVGDRHSDLFRFMLACDRLGHGFVVRATHNRYVNERIDRLWSVLEQQPCATTMNVSVRTQRSKGGKVTRRARDATLSLRYASVSLPPPVNDPRTADAASQTVWALLVREEDPPDDVEALEWMLLSSEAVTCDADARRLVGYYRCRWLIEEWHRCLKEGCRVERSQLDDAEDLKRLTSILGVVSVRLLQMRESCRRAGDDASQLSSLAPHEWIVMVSLLSGTEATTLTPRSFWLAIAKQGGHLNRKRDGPPGWKVIWRGWYDIQRMIQGAQLMSDAEKCG